MVAAAYQLENYLLSRFIPLMAIYILSDAQNALSSNVIYLCFHLHGYEIPVLGCFKEWIWVPFNLPI
jgi:hypothetical protein